MKRIIIALAALGLVANSNAQLWDGSPLPPSTFAGLSSVDNYFNDFGGVNSEFDSDIGLHLSLQQYGTAPMGITAANGWVDASTFAVTLDVGDNFFVTYLGKTAGWLNDFGMTIGGKNAYNIDGGAGSGAHTLWTSIDNGIPAIGDQYQFVADEAMSIDFWLNSGGNPAPALGGTYSVFFPETSDPSNTGPGYSARGKVFNVNDSFSGRDRSILVIAIEDWRNFDADFTDMFFAIEIYDRDGTPQFPVPEPSTYGLIGAMLLLGLAAIRRARR
jgi:hypothetical protein